jgi:ADP-ribosylglycohydrolase
MNLPPDYEERVYAGVLGKIIGVYLGRPFEGWHHDRIMAELGPIHYYVHERLGKPLVVTDDDISGTFTFLRALPDNGNTPDLTPAQIGWAWRNYIIEKRTILWWGGMGMSTEHTAFLRLKAGVEAPHSGSIATNGKVVAEQIGAQIFIDGWAMVCPGDPERAADLARRAASVSHDGEATYGAQVVAAMEAQAFVEPDLNKLLDAASGLIPKDSVIYALISDMRAWRAEEDDWQKTLRKVQAEYGYDKYGGNCHMVPNHAVILLGLLYGGDDFQKSLMIANTAGWDTDCNSGNVGCLMGIKNGLAGIDSGPDWRGPVADRMYLPTADGGRAVTDALRETYRVVNVGRALAGAEPIAPKAGARFHFSLPGAVQGFRSEDDTAETRGVARVENIERGPLAPGPDAWHSRVLALRYEGVAPGRAGRAATATFAPPEAIKMGGYGLVASPTLYPGQTVTALVYRRVQDGPRPATVGLYARVYTGDGARLDLLRAPNPVEVGPGALEMLAWEVPDASGRPIAEVGIEISGASGAGALLVDYLTWDGTPRVTLGRPESGGDMWRRAWIDAADHFSVLRRGVQMVYRVIQDEGTGLVFQGESAWGDYTVRVDALPHMADAVGLVANARGLVRYVALILGSDGAARLIEKRDRAETVLAEERIAWEPDRTYRLSLTSRRTGEVAASIDGGPALRARVEPDRAAGAVGLLVREGHGQFGAVTVAPA